MSAQVTPGAEHQTVLILDFGSQFTQLIARRVRENRVYCEVHPFDLPLDEIRRRRPSASSSRAGRRASTKRARRSPTPSSSTSASRPWASATACR